jgi:hypothetical protein
VSNKKSYLWEIVFTVGLAATVMIVQRKASKPDFGKTVQMKAFWSVKHFAQGQADFWQHVAGNAANAYNSLKL